MNKSNKKEIIKRLEDMDVTMAFKLYVNAPDKILNNNYLYILNEKQITKNRYQKIVVYQHNTPNQASEYSVYEIVVEKRINDNIESYHIIDFNQQ